MPRLACSIHRRFPRAPRRHQLPPLARSIRRRCPRSCILAKFLTIGFRCLPRTQRHPRTEVGSSVCLGGRSISHQFEQVRTGKGSIVELTRRSQRVGFPGRIIADLHARFIAAHITLLLIIAGLLAMLLTIALHATLVLIIDSSKTSSGRFRLFVWDKKRRTIRRGELLEEANY